MKKAIATIMVFFILPASLAWGAPDAKLCENYNSSYEHGNKRLALILAESIGDNSAPRATTRQLEELNARTQQLILIQQMEAHGCEITKSISSGSDYLLSALQCSNEKLKRNYDSPKCDLSTWTKAPQE